MRVSEKASIIVLMPLLFLGLLTPQLCRADDITTGLQFQTANQSMWGSGAASEVNYQLFNVDAPVNVNDTFGSISTIPPSPICFPFVPCIQPANYGVEIKAAINGDVGAKMNLQLTAGDVNATVPVNVTLGFPTTVQNNAPVTITSSGLFRAGASLTSDSPGVNLSMDVSANLSGAITGEACAANCTSVGTTLNVNGTKNLFTKNLVSSLVGKSFPIPPPPDPPYFVAEVKAPPYVGTSATTTAPSDAANPLTFSSSAVADSPFLAFNADISNMIAALFGLAPLDASVDLAGTQMSYDLFRFLAGVGLNSTQAFTLEAVPTVAYSIQDIGSNPQTLDSGPMDVAGLPYTFSIPAGDTAAVVTPRYSMHASLKNQTGVVPAINLEFSALGLKYGSIGVSSLVDKQFDIPFNNANFNFFDQTFPLLGWNTIPGTPFEITATNPTAAVPEPPTLLLVGAGLVLLGRLLRRRIQANAVGHPGILGEPEICHRS